MCKYTNMYLYLFIYIFFSFYLSIDLSIYIYTISHYSVCWIALVSCNVLFASGGHGWFCQKGFSWCGNVAFAACSCRITFQVNPQDASSTVYLIWLGYKGDWKYLRSAAWQMLLSNVVWKLVFTCLRVCMHARVRIIFEIQKYEIYI